MADARSAAYTDSEGARVGNAPDSGNAGDERPVQPTVPSDAPSAACPHIDHGEFTLCEVERERRAKAKDARFETLTYLREIWEAVHVLDSDIWNVLPTGLKGLLTEKRRELEGIVRGS